MADGAADLRADADQRRTRNTVLAVAGAVALVAPLAGAVAWTVVAASRLGRP